jgi:hypothetical protein
MTTAITSSAASRAISFSEFFMRMKKEPIYVILGVQGSGTNLLRSLLVRAFNFSFVQDQSLVYNAALSLGQAPPAAAVRQQFDGLYERLFPSALTRKTSRRIKSNSSYEGIDQHFDPELVRSGADLAHFVYAYGAYTRGTTLMAIKSDDLWETIAGIDTVLPNRRIILLTRDFRDNLLSITQKDFGPIDPLVAARYVKQRFAHYDAEYRRTNSAERLHVRYEELLDAPDAFVARFRQQFLSGTAQPPPPVDQGRIRRNNKRKWASLSRRQLALCEAILRDELNEYGYGTECEPVPPPGTAAWLLAGGRDAVKRVPQKLGGVAKRLRR